MAAGGYQHVCADADADAGVVRGEWREREIFLRGKSAESVGGHVAAAHVDHRGRAQCVRSESGGRRGGNQSTQRIASAARQGRREQRGATNYVGGAHGHGSRRRHRAGNCQKNLSTLFLHQTEPARDGTRLERCARIDPATRRRAAFSEQTEKDDVSLAAALARGAAGVEFFQKSSAAETAAILAAEWRFCEAPANGKSPDRASLPSQKNS